MRKRKDIDCHHSSISSVTDELILEVLLDIRQLLIRQSHIKSTRGKE